MKSCTTALRSSRFPWLQGWPKPELKRRACSSKKYAAAAACGRFEHVAKPIGRIWQINTCLNTLLCFPFCRGRAEANSPLRAPTHCHATLEKPAARVQKKAERVYVATIGLRICLNHTTVECAHQASPTLGAASAASSVTQHYVDTFCTIHIPNAKRVCVTTSGILLVFYTVACMSFRFCPPRLRWNAEFKRPGRTQTMQTKQLRDHKHITHRWKKCLVQMMVCSFCCADIVETCLPECAFILYSSVGFRKCNSYNEFSVAFQLQPTKKSNTHRRSIQQVLQ